MSNFRYPKITGRTNEEKIGQIVSFLRQLVDDLNYEGPDGQTAQTLRELGDKVTEIQEHLDMKNS